MRSATFWHLPTAPSWNASAVLECLECERLFADAHFHGEALHRRSTFHSFYSEWSALRSFFSVLQYTSDVIVVPCFINCTMSAHFLSQRTVDVSFLVDNVCLNLSASLTNVCVSTALTALRFQRSQMKPRFRHLLLVSCDWEIHRHFCGIALKESAKAEAILCVLCAPVSIFGTYLALNLR
jgi:hypothetical protein